MEAMGQAAQSAGMGVPCAAPGWPQPGDGWPWSLLRWSPCPCRNYSAVCVYSLGDIDKVFRTSSLKGYHSGLPNPRPGKCLPDQQPIPTETFQVADSHPEVAQRVEPVGPLKTPLFHSKYHYQKVVVHRMQASHGETFHVLYLTTGEGFTKVQ
ncbi:semaphorin-7A-like [Tupaia chinensis]|uniref:semaphorin-7A-like n=1 Tax=Tupaia chinensis TaxID=246437 RepID=UPI000FFB6B0B|nr:semaphorin-7A-like [Tupaia chinensis]